MSWFNYNVSHCDVIFLLLLQEPTVNVTKCMDSRNEIAPMKMRCEQDEVIQPIQIEVISWRANSGNNCEEIDLYDRSRYNCKRFLTPLTEKISRRCGGKRICSYEPKYHNWHSCPGIKDLPSRPIFLEIAFKCVVSKYV